jgi:uncharacterized protein (TIGR01777 family)
MNADRTVVVAGASGFIGQALGPALSEAGFRAVGLSRSSKRIPGYQRVVAWDPAELGPWSRELEGAAAVINFSGSSIGVRLTSRAREEIVASRVRPTLAIGQAIAATTSPPAVWINASAIGIYGDRGDELLTEASKWGDEREFLVRVGRSWEEATRERDLPRTRVIQLRLGLVLDNSKFLGTLRRLTLCFLGGSLGGGKQYVSWIMLDDVVALIRHLLQADVTGPVNATAPEPVRNRELMALLRHELHRPWSPPVPRAAVWLFGKLIGPDAEVSLTGQRVIPRKALDSNFQFHYPEFAEALRTALAKLR